MLNALVVVVAALVMWVALVFIYAAPVMVLWNILMPSLFDLPSVTYLQSVGLLVLSGMLFKSSRDVKID